MKKIIFITICFLALSCNKQNENNEVEKLLKKIAKLEIENKRLNESVTKNEENFLHSQILLGIPDKPVLKLGDKTEVSMLFQTFDREIPKYDIYRVEGKKQIKIGTNNQTQFKYEFIPKKIGIEELNLIVKMPYNGKVIEIPAGMYFKVIK